MNAPTNFAHTNCAQCGEYHYCSRLHGDRGGPLCCLPCIGKWDAEHIPRRRARRSLIRALNAYEAVGGSLYGKDLDDVRFVAGGIICTRDAAVFDFHDLTLELLTSAIALTHPDLHPPERRTEAQRVTQELLALKPFVFPAPEPEPPPAPESNDASSNSDGEIFSKLSLYPCEDCRDTVPLHYCNVCKVRWEEEQEKERAREEEQRVAKNARQRQRYHRIKKWNASQAKPTACGTCGKSFKPKRSDAQYCSAACRQRAYVKRDGKPSNARPLSGVEIERTIIDVLTSNLDNAFTTVDLCVHVYPGVEWPERKQRAAVVAAAKKVCERLGEHWDWWRGGAGYYSQRGAPMVFFNRASITSYAMARLKSDWMRGDRSEAELKARIAPGGDHYEYVVEGGAWWKHCQEDIAEFKKTTARQNDLEGDLTIRHGDRAPPTAEAAE